MCRGGGMQRAGADVVRESIGESRAAGREKKAEERRRRQRQQSGQPMRAPVARAMAQVVSCLPGTLRAIRRHCRRRQGLVRYNGLARVPGAVLRVRPHLASCHSPHLIHLTILNDTRWLHSCATWSSEVDRNNSARLEVCLTLILPTRLQY